MFEDMYILIVAFAMSLQSMAWLTVLIVLGLFLCSIFLTQVVGQDDGYRDLDFGRGSSEDLFGSVGRSMYTLFELMTMENWNGIGRPLVMKSGWFVVFFICFFMLFSFGLMNMVVGLVVEKTIAQSRDSKKNKEKAKQVEARNAIKDLRAVYLEIDGNGDGVLTLEEMEKSIDNPLIKKALERLGVPTEHITDLFDILDVDQSSQVDVEEFIEGMTKIKGQFRNRDFVAAEVAIKVIDRIQTKIQEKLRAVRENEAEIHRVMTRVEDILSFHQRKRLMSNGVESSQR
jgi:Ca2+-binding EF-hand superfamily protein